MEAFGSRCRVIVGDAESDELTRDCGPKLNTSDNECECLGRRCLVVPCGEFNAIDGEVGIRVTVTLESKNVFGQNSVCIRKQTGKEAIIIIYRQNTSSSGISKAGNHVEKDTI